MGQPEKSYLEHTLTSKYSLNFLTHDHDFFFKILFTFPGSNHGVRTKQIHHTFHSMFKEFNRTIWTLIEELKISGYLGNGTKLPKTPSPQQVT